MTVLVDGKGEFFTMVLQRIDPPAKQKICAKQFQNIFVLVQNEVQSTFDILRLEGSEKSLSYQITCKTYRKWS